MSIGKAVADLERTGDEAAKIARMTLRLFSRGGNVPRRALLRDVRAMAALATQMLGDVLRAFDEMDVDAALEVAAGDAELDREFRAASRRLSTYVMEDSRQLGHTINALTVVKALERIGDHAKNIAEHIVFLVTGQDVRHADADVDGRRFGPGLLGAGASALRGIRGTARDELRTAVRTGSVCFAPERSGVFALASLQLPSRRVVNLIGAAICAVLMGFALYSQYVDGLEPCPLCALPAHRDVRGGIVLLVAAVHGRGASAGRIYGRARGTLRHSEESSWQGGHVWLQSLPPTRFLPCGPGLGYILDTFPARRGAEAGLRGLRRVREGRLDLPRAEHALLGARVVRHPRRPSPCGTAGDACPR
jgi:disulfide bond formation protein DsbB